MVQRTYVTTSDIVGVNSALVRGNTGCFEQRTSDGNVNHHIVICTSHSASGLVEKQVYVYDILRTFHLHFIV